MKITNKIQRNGPVSESWFDIKSYVTVLCLLALLFLPLVLNGYQLGVLVFCFYTAVFAMSWDLLFGYLDEVNFGPTFLIGTGAYSAALCNVMLGIPVWLSIALGGVASLIAGYWIAKPALRLTGPYFGLVTLVAVLLLEGILMIFSRYTGGELGLTLNNVISIDDKTNYYVALTFMVFSTLVMKLIVWSPIGLIMQAVGQDQIAAAAMGFNVQKYKLFAFMVSALFSGVSGALMVFYLGAVAINIVVAVVVTVNIIIASIIGGRRTIVGSILGSMFIVFAGEILRPFGALGTAGVFAFALVVVVVFPDGLLGIFHNLKERRL